MKFWLYKLNLTSKWSVLHLWSKFSDPSLSRWWVIAQTNFKLKIVGQDMGEGAGGGGGMGAFDEKSEFWAGWRVPEI